MKPFAFLLAFAALSAPLLAGETVPAKFPSVDHPGRTVVRFDDGALRLVVGYRHAALHHDGRWIALDLGVTTKNESTTFSREHFTLVAPDGTRVHLARQQEVAERLPLLDRFLAELAVAADPLDGYFPARPREVEIEFFRNPKSPGVVLDQFDVDGRTFARGLLFFEAPTERFTPGVWVLEVRNRDFRAELPIELLTEAERKDN